MLALIQLGRLRFLISASGQGYGKTRPSQGCSELFSQLPSAAEPISAIGFCNDEIEMKILRASSAFEFSYSLGQNQTLGNVRCGAKRPQTFQ